MVEEFETERMSIGQRDALAHRCDDALKKCHILQLAIDLVDRQEKERGRATIVPHG